LLASLLLATTRLPVALQLLQRSMAAYTITPRQQRLPPLQLLLPQQQVLLLLATSPQQAYKPYNSEFRYQSRQHLSYNISQALDTGDKGCSVGPCRRVLKLKPYPSRLLTAHIAALQQLKSGSYLWKDATNANLPPCTHHTQLGISGTTCSRLHVGRCSCGELQQGCTRPHALVYLNTP
jgi:hypothetical protein